MKNRSGIKDKHLILVVLCLTLVDIVVLTIYTLVEWIITQFNVDMVVNKEKPHAITGVSQNNVLCYVLTSSLIITRIRISRLFTSFTLSLQIPGFEPQQLVWFTFTSTFSIPVLCILLFNYVRSELRSKAWMMGGILLRLCTSQVL